MVAMSTSMMATTISFHCLPLSMEVSGPVLRTQSTPPFSNTSPSICPDISTTMDSKPNIDPLLVSLDPHVPVLNLQHSERYHGEVMGPRLAQFDSLHRLCAIMTWVVAYL